MKLSRNQIRSIRRLSMLIAGAYALAPSNSLALDADEIVGGAGLNLGITFNKNFSPRLTIGIEAYLVQHIEQANYELINTTDMNLAVGSMVQLNYVAKDGLQTTIGLTAGQANYYDQNVFMGELGTTYRFKQNDWGLRVGALFEPMAFNTAIRHDFFIEQTTLNAGIRIPGTFAGLYSAIVMEGRPLRTDNNNQQRETRHVVNSLATKWADMAQDEFEAVFAFGNLAFELMMAGAPQSLIDQALDSGEQEVAHAKYCADQAAQFDESFALTAPCDLFRNTSTGVDSLSRLAMEGLIDGWYGEGLAAQKMQAGAKQTTNQLLKQNLEKISSEETGHANLGSNIAKWAISKDNTGIVREHVAALHQTDLGSLTEEFSDPKSGFIKFRQLQNLSDQTRDGLNGEIDRILVM
ncbi:hypothetical protein [Marinicellulosiphila megalodicopiae]|uniref:hypothetical protein n=1 Tax=Marinicellulosiphila megalodicopiae TaxID=2724896 RepID=UPI003BB110EF